MKISELIQRLQDMKEKVGDQEVMKIGTEGYAPIESPVYEEINVRGDMAVVL